MSIIKRWRAVATYREGREGVVSYTHEFDELEELHDIIEAGPDWACLEKIEIRYTMNVVDGEAIQPLLPLGTEDI